MFDSIPNLDDPFARIQERTHSSGAKIIEVLYGAHDTNGNPKYPEKKERIGYDDGHGHFIAIEIDGLYQVLSWRHSESEGGNMDEGSSRLDNPLKDLEDGIKEKKEILRDVRELMRQKNYDITSVDIILKKYELIFDYNTPKEQELKRQYDGLVSRNDENRRYREKVRNQQTNNAVKKRDLITKAQNLQSSTDWKNASNSMKVLMDQWKEIGYAGDQNEQLWSEFQSVRQSFYENRKKYYEERDRHKERSKQLKQQIISDARSIAQFSTDWNGTHQRLEELLSQWKQIGSVGRDEDDRLWSEFQSVRNNFYARRKAAKIEIENEFENRRQAKSRLIQEAQAYVSQCDYSPEASERMKSLSSEWKEVGFCGKNYEDSLWSLFRSVQDSFWLAKKQMRLEKHQAWVDKTHGAIDRRKERIYRIEQNIDNLRERLYNTRNYEKRIQIEGWINEDEEKIREIQDEIFRMESELS